MSYNENSRWLVDRAKKMGLSYEEAQSLAKRWLGTCEVSRSAYAHHTDCKMTGDDDPPNSIRGDR